MRHIERAMDSLDFPIRSTIRRYALPCSQTDVSRSRVAIVVGTDPAAESLARCLRSCGVETRISSSAAEALEHSCDLKPDLIVSDVNLGDMSAVEAGCQIRNLLPHCAVLFYSGALLNRIMDDSESQVAIGKSLLQLAFTAARAQRMYLIRTYYQELVSHLTNSDRDAPSLH